MGTHLGCKLTQSVSRVLLIPMHHVVFWCDSTNVLWWLRGHCRIFKPFVTNRIGEIQSVTNPDQWRHVPTGLNPVDCLTRGLQVDELIDREGWWRGPDYLQSVEKTWQKNKRFEHDVFLHATKEVKRKYCEVTQLQNIEIQQSVTDIQSTTMIILDHNETCWRLNPEHFSSWKRLIRILSWVIRFMRNCHVNKEHRTQEELILDELKDAEKQIVKSAQRKVFRVNIWPYKEDNHYQ